MYVCMYVYRVETSTCDRDENNRVDSGRKLRAGKGENHALEGRTIGGGEQNFGEKKIPTVIAFAA